MSQHLPNPLKLKQQLRQLVTRQLLQPEQSFHPNQFQPHLLLSGSSLLLYRLGLVIVGSLLLGSLFGFLYGPSVTMPLKSLIAFPTFPKEIQGWEAVWPIALPQLWLWARLSWLAGIGIAFFGLSIGTIIGTLDRIRTVGSLHWSPKRVAAIVGVTVAIALVGFTLLPAATVSGMTLALLPNLLWFAGIKATASPQRRSLWFHWRFVILINGLIGLLHFGDVILFARLWTLRYDWSLLAWPWNLKEFWFAISNTVFATSYSSSMGLVFFLRSPIVTSLFSGLQRWWLRVTLAVTGQLPWNQTHFWQHALQSGYLKETPDGFEVSNFQALMESDGPEQLPPLADPGSAS